jgi:hypothetical protein
MSQRTALVCALLTAMVIGTVGCSSHGVQHLPPAQQLMEPGPGVGGPGPGVMMNSLPVPAQLGVSQLAFLSPAGMWVTWDASGQGRFDSEPLVAPGRQNFPQGGIYRLKLTNIPGRNGVELYPTIEVGPTTPRTEAYLAHNYIPIQLTDEDLDQVLSGNFVTKVIYLPDNEFQEMAQAGIETLVSTRLDPGVDPIAEADRRGSILCILRIGNKDEELPGGANGPDMAYQGGGVEMASYCPGCAGGGGMGGMPGPNGMPMASGMGGMAPGYVAGVTAPQYGMPYCGTPIGLPGPPHIPLGVPAGLQKHVIVNHTAVNMPKPVKKLRIDVQQHPGYSYPDPVRHVRIDEHNEGGGAGAFNQPWCDKVRSFCGF